MTSTIDRFDRMAPHSIDSESCLLGSMLLAGANPALLADTRGTLKPPAFFQPDHGILFEVLCDIDDSGRPIDAMLVREELEKRGQLDKIGGVEFLAGIIATVPNAANGPHYARIVKEKAVLRAVLSACQKAEQEVYAATDSSDPGVEIAQRLIGRLGRLMSGTRAAESQDMESVIADVLDGLETGETGAINLGISGIEILPGETFIVGGRPSMGKSTFGKQIAIYIASLGIPALIISLEESKRKIGRNALSAASGVDNHKLRSPKTLTPADWRDIVASAPRLTIPLFVNDSARTLDDIRAAIAGAVARHGVRFVMVDYLQRITVPGAKRFDRVTDASIGVSDMFREFGVAGLVLAQLSRDVAGREDKRPTMSDLRESGQIEQDADGILFLHRQDYYNLSNPNYTPTGEAELIVAKMRDGVRNRIIRLKSNLRTQSFQEIQSTPTDPFDSANSDYGDGGVP